MNTQNTVDAKIPGAASQPGATAQRPEEAIRVPTAREFMLRVFGFKRGQSLYGVEGDQLAAKYPQKKKFGWALGYDEPIPLFLEQSRLNQMKAYCMLIAMAVIGLFVVSTILSAGSRDASAQLGPPAELSPAEKLLMSTVQQQLGVSDKAMNEYYHPKEQPPPPEQVEQPAPTEHVGEAPHPHHPPSMRTFGLRAQREQAQMQQQQYGVQPQQYAAQPQYGSPGAQPQYGMPAAQEQYAAQPQYGSPGAQPQYGMPAAQHQYGAQMQQQPQRMQVYVDR